MAADILIYEPSIWEKTWWFLKLHVAWPSLSLVLILIFAWIVLIPVKARVKKFRMLYLSIAISLFCIWYFYPCLNYRGTYSGTYYFKGSEGTSLIVITDKYRSDENNLIDVSYTLKPFKRMIQVELPTSSVFSDQKFLPIKLGYNSIKQPVFFCGWVKHTKIK